MHLVQFIIGIAMERFWFMTSQTKIPFKRYAVIYRIQEFIVLMMTESVLGCIFGEPLKGIMAFE